LKSFLTRSLVLGLPLVLVCCAGTPDPVATDPSGSLKPCPSSPNCVSTRAADADKRMAPLPYRGDRAASRGLLLSILAEMPRATVVTTTDAVLHVEFRSALFGFVDDVEFVFDDAAEAVHFRSASRSGYWDLGANRRRMTAIGEAYRKARQGAPAE
jgi:uncharacterized protein (DUF1499 family)